MQRTNKYANVGTQASGIVRISIDVSTAIDFADPVYGELGNGYANNMWAIYHRYMAMST